MKENSSPIKEGKGGAEIVKRKNPTTSKENNGETFSNPRKEVSCRVEYI